MYSSPRGLANQPVGTRPRRNRQHVEFWTNHPTRDQSDSRFDRISEGIRYQPQEYTWGTIGAP
jgi:hypothetical protein